MVEQKKDVIYLPYWILGALQRNNMDVSTVLDYRTMAKFFSAQELANMLLFEDLNPFKETVAEGRHQPTFGMIDVDASTSVTECGFGSPLYEAWRKCVVGSSNANDNALLRNLDTFNSLSWNDLAKQEVLMRYDPANAGRIGHDEPFITYDVERSFLIVVVYPAFYESAKYASNVINLCKSVLKTFYVYNTPASGCKTPYFRRYLESLA